ncbi:MAG TPA: hypothetical protein GXZ82_11810 [Firmicutes bacterium]|jgi:hypothetical protein|nr:hypothetical protein [Bacillota bacterium]
MSSITTDPFWRWVDRALLLLFAVIAIAVLTNPEFGAKLRNTLSHILAAFS